MIYEPPKLQTEDLKVMYLLDQQRESIRYLTQFNPKRWTGSLRRVLFAKAVQGSNSIEGINADIDTAVAAIEGEPPLDEDTETHMAIGGYRAALTYIVQAAQDQYFEFSKQFLKSLHFLICGYTMASQPGQWRNGPVFVVNSKASQVVYEAPPHESVNGFVEELITYLKGSSESALVRAAMAHLNLTMIHPFKDGNGRVARALQTLVMAQDGLLHPVFSSIEEWLGDNTQEYYEVLALTGQGKWNPQRDSLSWVRFCIKAHYQSAAKISRRDEEAAKLYDGILSMIAREHLPERTWNALFDSAFGLRVTNARYRKDAEITDHTASRDLKRLSDCGLLIPEGEKRARVYKPAPPIIELRRTTRIRRPLEDPYLLVKGKRVATVQEDDEARLPGL
jgi:Fic family protein